jgi:hypothetical protein
LTQKGLATLLDILQKLIWSHCCCCALFETVPRFSVFVLQKVSQEIQEVDREVEVRPRCRRRGRRSRDRRRQRRRWRRPGAYPTKSYKYSSMNICNFISLHHLGGDDTTRPRRQGKL